MSVVLDAYAIIAALIGEKAGREAAPLLKGGTVCAANLAEVLDVCIRVHGNTEATVRERIGWLIRGGLEVAALDSALAIHAGALRAKHYQKRRAEVSLGDCYSLALSISLGVGLATADPALATAARQENVDLIGLPDSQGRRP